MSSWEDWAAEPSVGHVPRESVYEQNSYYDPHYGGSAGFQDAHIVDTRAQGGGTSVENAYVVDTAAPGGERGAWVNSDDYMAAPLIYAIHEGERL